VFGFAALAWRPAAGTLAIAMLIPAVATLIVSLRIARGFGKVAQPFRAADMNAGLTAFAKASALEKPCATPAFRRDVAPIGAGILLSALYFRIDVFLVQLWSGTESVALYNAVFRVIEGLRLFPAAALAVALPALCRARDLRPLMNVSLTLVAGGCLATAIAWPAADWIVPFLFGDRYAPAIPAFRILLLSFPLLSLNYALTHQLIGWDGQRAYAGICAAALLVNLALNARLIPALSIDGAAWATIGTEVVVTAGCAIALARASTVAALTVADSRMG
jgi:O-antigen/teichoic acid export membrane protein